MEVSSKDVSQIQYGLIKAMNFTTAQWWLEKYDIKMYSTHNEGKYVVTERFIRTLKN